MSATAGLEPLRAGVGDYLPLLVFFVIWWVSQRRARKNRSRQEGQGQAALSGPSRPPEATDGVEGITPMDVLRQMLFGGLEMPPMPAPQPPPAVEPVPANSGEPRRTTPGWQAAPPPPLPLAERVVTAPLPNEAARGTPARRVSPPAESAPRAEKTALVQAHIPRRELQRALAWSEVLAPPVGLRDTSH